MNIKALVCLAVILGLHSQAQSSTYTNLVVPGFSQTASLSVSTGQVARIVTARLRAYNSSVAAGQITVTVGSDSFIYQADDFAGVAVARGTPGPPTVVGPATITLSAIVGTGASPIFCTIELTSPAAQLMPSTAVVIPADSGGPVNIILESSVDLVNWTAALPGTYGTTTTNRFFRVRAERTQ